MNLNIHIVYAMMRARKSDPQIVRWVGQTELYYKIIEHQTEKLEMYREYGHSLKIQETEEKIRNAEQWIKDWDTKIVEKCYQIAQDDLRLHPIRKKDRDMKIKSILKR